MKRHALRTRLIVSVVAAASVLTALAGVAMHVMARRYLTAQFDRDLTGMASRLLPEVYTEHGEVTVDFEDMDMREFASPRASGYLQIWFEGLPVYRSPALGEADLSREGAGPPPGRPHRVTLPNDQPGRGVVVRFAPKREDEDHGEGEDRNDDARAPNATPGPGNADAPLAVTLALARDSYRVERTLSALRWGLLVVAGALALTLAGVIRIVVARGLRPVQSLALHLEALDSTDLGRAIDQPGLPRELQPILDRFNAVLGRLHDTFERERRFSADVAHELRTPIAALRSTLEVTRSQPRSPEHYAQRLDELWSVTTQMQAMVERLFALTTLERQQTHPTQKSKPIDLDAAVRAVWAQARQTHPRADDFTLRDELACGGRVFADPALLDLVVRNLLDNAISYVNPGGTVTLATQTHQDRVTLTVRNSGSAVAAEDAPRVFDRFWRADAARAQTGTHAGLGLSIAQLTARGMHATLQIHSNAGGDFTATLTLPAAPVNGNHDAEDTPARR